MRFAGFALWLAAATSSSAPQAPGQVASPPAPPEEARAARLALQRAELEAEIAAMEKFGHHEELLARLASYIDAPDYSQRPRDLNVPVGPDDVLYYQDIEAFVRWHRPIAGRALPAWADAEARNHPLPVIVDFGAQLRAHGIGLLVVAIPTRFEIHPELLIDVAPSEAVAGFVGMGIGTAHLLLDLNAAGIETLDLRPSFAAARGRPHVDHDDRLFLRTDKHWTPRGAELAATQVAARVASLPWFVQGPLKEGKDYTLDRGPVEVVNPHVPHGEEEGAPAECRETVPATLVVKGKEPFDFGSDRSRIIVLGDSFVDYYQQEGASFTAHLARLLGHRLDLVSARGGTARETRAKLATWDAARWANRKLVIWFLSTPSISCWHVWEKLEVFPR